MCRVPRQSRADAAHGVRSYSGGLRSRDSARCLCVIHQVADVNSVARYLVGSETFKYSCNPCLSADRTNLAKIVGDPIHTILIVTDPPQQVCNCAGYRLRP